jgi:chromosome segregation ATPase
MIDYKNYKSYIIVGAVCFALGYLLAGIGAGGRLHDLRIRAEQAIADLREARTAQQSATRRAENLQNELDAAGKRIGELQNRIDRITKSVEPIKDGINAAQKLSNDSGELIEESRSILRKVQKRGRSKN